MDNQPSPTLDSETSVDYYVTTQKPGRELNGKFDVGPKVMVSVDRAGSVKVRKRKKSKRRKKHSNLGLDDQMFMASDDETRLHSSSDGNQKKVPKRSSSLCERDLNRNSKVFFTDDTISKTDLNKENVVKRRVKKRSSFKNNRKAIMLDPDIRLSGLNVKGEENTLKKVEEKPLKSSEIASNSDTGLSQHKLPTVHTQQSALATLDAFMIEVQEATTEAKQQLVHNKEKHKVVENEEKVAPVRRSLSMTGIRPHISADESAPNSNENHVADVHYETMSKKSSFVHQKQESFGQVSLKSVFLSEPDLTRDDFPVANYTATDNEVSRKSIYDMLLDYQRKLSTDANTEQNSLKPMVRRTDADAGLAHLERICKLMEQVADLRKENYSLKRRVISLEAEVEDLKSIKGVRSLSSTSSMSKLPSYRKRSHAIDRIKNNLARRSSYERNIDMQRLESFGKLPRDTNNGFSTSMPNGDRPVIYSNVTLKKNKRHSLYSRDDLDLSIKGKWKFWRAPNRTDASHQSRKQVVQSIKAEHMQGSAVHLKSASVTLDSLLNNLDDDFSQKMLQWESKSINRSASQKRTHPSFLDRQIQPSYSAVCLPTAVDTNDNHRRPSKSSSSNKDSIKKRFKRWDKTRKLSFSSRRSKSVDRMNAEPDDLEFTLDRDRSVSVGHFHQSTPCIQTELDSEKSFENQSINNDNNITGTTEWSALQQAFPTKPASSNHSNPFGVAQRIISASQSRLSAPLRKKNSKRRSWSFMKRPSSKYFLPTSGDFASNSNLNFAENIGDQLTLDLNMDDVQGLISADSYKADEINYLNKNTEELREKLNSMERKCEVIQETKRRPRPASSMAQFNRGQSAPSFLLSKPVETQRQFSFNSPIMSPLIEEPHSLPTTPSFKTATSARRHTIALLSPGGNLHDQDKLVSHSAPCSLDNLTPVHSVVTQHTVKSAKKPSDLPIIQVPDIETPETKFASHDNVFKRGRKSFAKKVLHRIPKHASKQYEVESSLGHLSPHAGHSPKRRFNLFGSFRKSKRKNAEIPSIEVENISPVDHKARRSSWSPPRIRKGLVSRLSKRFNNANRDSESKNNPNEVPVRLAEFANTRDLFEARSGSESRSYDLNLNKNNNNNHIVLCVY